MPPGTGHGIGPAMGGGSIPKPKGPATAGGGGHIGETPSHTGSGSGASQTASRCSGHQSVLAEEEPDDVLPTAAAAAVLRSTSPELWAMAVDDTWELASCGAWNRSRVPATAPGGTVMRWPAASSCWPGSTPAGTVTTIGFVVAADEEDETTWRRCGELNRGAAVAGRPALVFIVVGRPPLVVVVVVVLPPPGVRS